MDQIKKTASNPRTGINRSTDIRNLQENDTTYILNGNIENVEGDYIDYSCEKSNVLSVNFPIGYKVIGRVNRLSRNWTYYFLTNPVTKKSLFGYVDNNTYFSENHLEDVDGELPTPLEDQVQVPYNSFNILIDDSCSSNGFNFNINFPIHNPLIKEEKTGGEIYFTDFHNPSRFIKLDDIEHYFIEEVPCSQDVVTNCADFEKMRVHKQYDLPKISDVTIANGGTLKKGSYTFIVALSDAQGNEISEYSSITQPISIWDREEQTGQAIKLTITDLDPDYNHYKIVSLTPVPVEVGVFSTSTREITISDLSQNQRTSIEKVSFINTKVKKSEGFTAIQNSLAEYGLVFEEELNLQPIVNLMGSFLQWQTHVGREDLYSHGDMRSKFLGFNRNEIVPYSIRFLLGGGSTTALFPLVGREATAFDREIIPDSNLDRKSFLDPTLCDQGLRNQRWQYYNTAMVTGACGTEEEGVEVTETFSSNCTEFNTGSTGQGSMFFEPLEEFYNLETYIEENKEGCQGKLSGTNICEKLTQNYNANCEVTFEQSCSIPQKISEVNFISEIVGEKSTDVFGANIPFMNPVSDQSQTMPPHGTIFAPGNSYVNEDAVFVNRSNPIKYPLEGSTPTTAISMAIGPNLTQGRTATAPSDSWRTTIYLSIPKEKTINVPGYGNLRLDWGNYMRDPHFYKAKITEPVSIHLLFDTRLDTNPEGGLVNMPDEFIKDNTVRVTLLRYVPTDNNPQGHFLSFLTSDIDSKILTCTPDGTNLIVRLIDASQNVLEEYILNSFGPDGTLLVSLDFPTVSVPYEGTDATKFTVKLSPRASFFPYMERLSYIGKKVEWDDIKVSTNIFYETTCTYIEPLIKSCETSKYKKGDFAYWESERTYPDNSELYDSSKLIIDGLSIPSEYRTAFASKFSSGASPTSEYQVKPSFNLTCKPIRHFRFPDNKVSPFMTNTRIAGFGESYIYPLGVTIDENYINILLDIAVQNKLISKEQRDSIYGYEIFRGNLAVDRTVISSGLLYDMREYSEGVKTVKYSNYPYNSYSNDKLNSGASTPIGFGVKGSQYTYNSPETDYFGNIRGTELSIQGYQFGMSKGWFDEVQDHPKMVILSNRAYNTAEDLATTEVIAESIIGGAEALTNVGPLWIVAGVGSSGTNGGGYAAGVIAASLVTATILAEGFLHRYATYKYQWLETFKNLGRQTNFASYYFSEGNYNYLLTSQSEGNSVRNLRVNKKLKEGRYVVTDNISKEKIEINNIDREQSVFLKVDDITYPSVYSSFDTSSLTYLGENGLSSTGRSPQIDKNIASPYVQIINRNPAVHGDIDSVQWISTSYRGNLKYPQTTCLPIFGGDTFISRHTLKRKMPLFLSTLMGQANMTPFDYKVYNNIGTEPAFYVNYDVNSDFSTKGKMFPELRSEFRFDNETSKGFYYRNPSKFYLYYYGVPSFLTETRVNTNFREIGREPGDNFVPEVGDIGWWTQEKNVPIRTPNYFKYDQQFSNQTNSFNYRTLPSNFSRRNQNVVESATNGVIFSLPDNDENGQLNPWLKFRPLDFFEFESKYGKLKELKSIENEAVLARFADTSIIYNKVSSTVDDGNSSATFLGGRDIFQRRTTSFVNSELGFGGTQHSESLSCEFGHFYVDNKRGQVIQIPPGGGNMIEISNVNSFGKSTNMKDWFKRNLPFRLLESNIEGLEPDNTYNLIGTTFGYDSLHKRVLITKKDYIPLSECIAYNKEVGFYNTCGTVETPICPDGYTFNEVSRKCEKKVYNSLCPEGYEYNPLTGMCGTEGCLIRLAFIVDNSIADYRSSIGFLLKTVITITDEYPDNNFTWSLQVTGSNDSILETENVDEFLMEVENLMNQPSTSGPNNLGEKLCHTVALIENPWGELPEHKYILTYMNSVPQDTPAYCNVSSTSVQDFNTTAEYFKNRGGKIYLQFLQFYDEDVVDFEEAFIGENPYPSEGLGEYGLAYVRRVSPETLEYESVYEVFGGYPICTNGTSIEVNCDCHVVEEQCECILEKEPTYEITDLISIDDPEYFKEVSWTIAYNPQMGYFSSFMDYLPNFYVNHDRFFETGRGNLWAHNKTNKSYGVFYGDKCNFEIETIAKGNLASYLGSVELLTEARRFHSNQDFYLNPDLTFNKSLIYNRKECSGELTLDIVKGSVARYPITENETSQRIPLTSRENTFVYNYFFDRTIKGNQKPFIKNDVNQIKIEAENISFKQKGQLARLNGDYFQNRLTYNTDSRFCLVMKLSVNLTNLDNL